MRGAAQLWLRILELGYRAPGIAWQVANVVIRWIRRRLVAREYCLGVIVQRRHYCFISLRVAAEQTIGLKCFQVQAIQKRPITFRGRTRSGEIDEIAGLHDWAHTHTAHAKTTATAGRSSASVTARYRDSRVIVCCVLPAIPQLARLGARLKNPRARPFGGAVGLGQERN